MNERDRFGRNREHGGFGQQQQRPWDRQRYQAESSGYPDEDRDRGYSRLGGAGEEDYERYQRGGYQGSYQTPREYDREYGGREAYGRDSNDERGSYGPERSYGQERGGQGASHGQRDWGQQRSASGSGSPYDSAMRDFGERSGYGYSGPRDSGGYEYGQRGQHSQGSSGSERGQLPYAGSAYGSQRSQDASRYGQGRQSGYGQAGQRGRFAGHGPKGYKRSDERIREDLCDALMMDPEIDASEIEVQVSDGEVTLTGSVQDRDDKWRAEQVADAIPGVREVTNSIRSRRGGNEQSTSSSDTSRSDTSRNAARSGAAGGSNVNQSGAGNSTRS